MDPMGMGLRIGIVRSWVGKNNFVEFLLDTFHTIVQSCQPIEFEASLGDQAKCFPCAIPPFKRPGHSRAAAGADWIFLEYVLIFSSHLSALPQGTQGITSKYKRAELGDWGIKIRKLWSPWFKLTNQQRNNTIKKNILKKIQYLSNPPIRTSYMLEKYANPPRSTMFHIWRFPKMGVPPNHPFLDGIFHHKPMAMETSIWRMFSIMINPPFKRIQPHNWLVVKPPLWKIWKSIGMIIPNIWENKIDVPQDHHLRVSGAFFSIIIEGELRSEWFCPADSPNL